MQLAISKTCRHALALALLLVALAPVTCLAQMFGPRSLGTPLGQQLRPGQPNAPRQPTPGGNPNENLMQALSVNMDRFFRDRRPADAFVGRDRVDVAGFVGANQAQNQGPILSAIGELREIVNPNVNRLRPQIEAARPGPYRPRLTLGFTADPSPAPVRARALENRLAKVMEDRLSGPVEVTLAGETAILEGAVASEHDRHVVAEWVRLEPGIAEIENRLRVATDAPPADLPAPSTATEPPSPLVPDLVP